MSFTVRSVEHLAGFAVEAGAAGSSPAAGNSSRYDSSLGLLTKKFLNLLQTVEDGIIDLNQAADMLGVRVSAVCCACHPSVLRAVLYQIALRTRTVSLSLLPVCSGQR
jgi:hypothetical protein